MNLNSLHISRTVAIGIILAIVVIAAIAYTLMNDGTDETITVSDPATTESEANFITLASELDSIAFDASVLSDPRFTSLVNINTAITPEPVGRSNPFSPIGR
ncbi:MAG: hypothetical protein AAB582_00740 [Patescibacteria group bacterium]